MSVNVKLGGDTISNVSAVNLENADSPGSYVKFGEGGYSTLENAEGQTALIGDNSGIVPSGNQDISDLTEYNVSSKATARISEEERAKIIPENIAEGVTILGVQGSSGVGAWNMAVEVVSNGN